MQIAEIAEIRYEEGQVMSPACPEVVCTVWADELMAWWSLIVSINHQTEESQSWSLGNMQPGHYNKTASLTSR